jgi:hypothetical protein
MAHQQQLRRRLVFEPEQVLDVSLQRRPAFTRPRYFNMRPAVRLANGNHLHLLTSS